MSGIACGAGMSMNMNMSGTPNGDADQGGPPADGACGGIISDTTTGTLSAAQAMTDAAAAQQQAQLLQKQIGAARTGSTESSNSSAGISRTSSHGSHSHHHNNNAHHDGVHKTTIANRGGQYSHPGIPVSRSSGSAGNNSLYKPTKHAAGSFDHDHHTFATATTASATISYSTDEVDHVNSDVSEAGMEVVMETDERVREQQILSLLDPHSTKTSRLAGKPKEEPYKSHAFPAGKHTFTVDTRYSFIRVIGSGAYGVVISAKDSKTDTDVAIKMVPRAFHDEIDAKRILREIKLLKHFRHENIVGIIDMMPPSVNYVEDFNDVYMVTDLMETDLHRIIYSKQKLSLDHVQYFVYQVLRGLKYIHSCNVLHRDLKPSNLLVNSNCDLKICDFGLARGIYDDSNSMDESNNDRGTLLLTEYVVTRWYRAPEIMLACHEYSKPIDVWSVGCIFAELILRKPYFPGDDYIDQVRTLFPSLA